MQRVYGLVEDDIVHRIDGDASVMGISRSKWVGLAIDTFLNRNGEDITGDHRIQGGESNSDDQNREIEHLKQIIAIKDGEIQHLRYLTNDLRSLADNLAMKVPALPGPQIPAEDVPQYADAKKKPLWMKLRFWTWV